jgi:hypothetical protein
MTTPSQPSPDDRATGEQPSEEPGRAEATPTETVAPPPLSRPAGPPPPPPYYPFAPVAREPWINPRRRGAVVGTAVGAGLAALAIGFGIGFAVAPSHDGPRMHRFDPGFDGRGGMGPMRGGWQPPFPDRHLPNRQQPAVPASPTAPSSSPSSS